MKFDAIVFDFDGVLVESTHAKTQAFSRLYAKYGKEMAQIVVEYHKAHAGISRYVNSMSGKRSFWGCLTPKRMVSDCH